MKLVYSVCLCRIHSGHLTSAHDSDFHLFDCCYLRTLESSWRAQELPPSIFSKLMDSPRDQLCLLPFNISILLLVRRMRTSRRYSYPEGKSIYSTYDDGFLSRTERTEMGLFVPCSHEEADTRLMVHILDAALTHGGQTFFC